MSESEAPALSARDVLLLVLAWLIPASGHLALRRRARAAVFALVILVALVVGVGLDGNLYQPVQGQPLSRLATLGAMGVGLPYFVLRWGLGYAGDPTSGSYEYGSAFLLSAGLMNLLLVLDVWDIARGRKP